MSWTNILFLQHNTMESLLERGEKLDDLVAKSEHLGNQSKAFYKTVSTNISSCQHWTESLMAIHCFRCLTVCMCVRVKPAGTQTELMLWNHVMSLPRPRGHASLCLSAFPTTPIMHLPPALDTTDRTDAVQSGMGHQDKSKKGCKVVVKRKRDLSGLWLMGAEGVMGLG